MTITAEELSAIIGAMVLLIGALAAYLRHLANSTKAEVVATNANVDALHDKVDALVAAPPVVLFDGHTQPPVEPPPRG